MLPLIYAGVCLPLGCFADIVLGKAVIFEIRSVERVMPVHAAQMQTYLRLSGYRVGLLINFNTAFLQDGPKRFVP